jgi:DNA-directed RNA polymerase specialized sigma24 family protein
MPSLIGDPPPKPLGELLEDAWSDLLALSRRELRSAGHLAAGESATSLLGEAVVRVLSQRNEVRNAEHLHGLTTMFLRRLIIDRRRKVLRHRAALRRIGRADPGRPPRDSLATDLAAALVTLGEYDQRKLATLTLSAVHGLRQPEVAEVLGTSLATVERDLRFGRAWIASRVGRNS